MPQNISPVITKQGVFTTLNLAAAGGAQVLKTTKGQVAKVSVIVAGSAVGAVYDRATTSGVAASNQLYVIPNTVGVYDLNMPFANGLVVTPGTGQTVVVSWA